jgi:hypothetical protein
VKDLFGRSSGKRLATIFLGVVFFLGARAGILPAQAAIPSGKASVNKVNPAKKTSAKSKLKKISVEETALSRETPLQANAVDLNLLRGLPLTIDGYETGRNMPETFSSAAQVIQAIDSSPVLLLHMEALRRSYGSLSKEAHIAVLETLLKRHQADEANLQIGFDYGYAQLLYNRNKTGLFFLRKANDQFKTQFTALAYGMAEMEADLALENAKPEEMTTRKLDVIYQLGDAVQRDSLAHQSGFWPSFVRVLQAMKSLPAYGSFPNRDFSLTYVPYGGQDKHLNLQATATPQTVPIQTSPVANLLNNSTNTGCTPQHESEAFTALEKNQQSLANPTGGRSVTFNKTTVLLQFYPSDLPEQSRVKVSDSKGQLLLSFKTFAKPASIVEDIDGDGTQEIVARQYKQDSFQPLLVYRFTPCGFELDHKIFDDFR